MVDGLHNGTVGIDVGDDVDRKAAIHSIERLIDAVLLGIHEVQKQGVVIVVTRGVFGVGVGVAYKPRLSNF